MLIKTLSDALHNLCRQTNQFRSGYPYVVARLGARPTYMLWFEGFTHRSAEVRADRQPEYNTLRWQLEIYCNLSGTEQDSQEQLWALTQAVHEAISASPRLGGIRGVLRTRLMSGQSDLYEDKGGDKLLLMVMQIEVDYAGPWGGGP